MNYLALPVATRQALYPKNLAKNSTENPVQFGWSEKSPPQQYQFALSRTDFDNFDDLIPAKALVDMLVLQMQRDDNSLEKPGFVVLTNTLPLLGSKNKVHYFQENLSRLVFERLHPDKPYAFKSEELDHYYVHQRGLREQKDKPQHVDGTDSWREAPHFDFYGASPSMISMSYGPFQGFTEGGFLLTDHRAAEKDWGYRVSQHNGYGVVSNSLRKMIASYSLRFNHLDFKSDMPVVLINNHYEGYGVAHGGLEPFVEPAFEQEAQEINRPLNRIWHFREPE